VARNLRRIRQEVKEAISQAMDDVANDLLDRSIALAPQLSGDLVNDARVVSLDTGNTFSRAVEYGPPGSPSTAYAKVRHEDVYNLGPISSIKPGSEDGPVGRKFLERPFNRHAKRYIEEVGREVERALRTGLS
jgi:hypothetical protein